MSLITNITAQVRATHTGTSDLSVPVDTLDQGSPLAWANGTGASQADLIFHDQRTTDTTGEDLDLAGSLTDAFGSTITFARVKAIYVKASSSNAGNVLVGGAASNQFDTWVGDATDVIAVRPGGTFILIAPDATAYSVTASTGDLLHVEAASGSVTYDLIIVGASA